MMHNPLLDREFLYQLDQYPQKEIFGRVIALTFDEQPIEQIEGRITGGSINIDGKSAVRRTCNLSIVAKDVNISDFYWGLSNKFKLEIGVKNVINSNYPDIIWFKQGIFVITSFSSSLTNNNFTISISGKDKMCLLNGDIGGNLHSTIDFGRMDTEVKKYTLIKFKDKNEYKANQYYTFNMNTKEYNISLEPFKEDQRYYEQSKLWEQTDIVIKDIIKEAVHVYGNEFYHNIIINDLDDYGLKLMEYRGDDPLYLLYDENYGVYTNLLYSPKVNIQLYDDSEEAKDNPYTEIIVTDLEAGSIVFNPGVDKIAKESTKFILGRVDDYQEENADDEKEFIMIPRVYSVTKIEKGHVIGYQTTDLTFAGELVASIGESLTSILDKIKNMLGAFEYFYDLDGKFIFQAAQTYKNKSWNTLVETNGDVFARDIVEKSKYSYSFENVNLISSFSNTPAINSLKNDYSVWGTRKGVTGQDYLVHARYAIQDKPTYYKSFDGIVYTTDLTTVVPQPDKSRLPECLREGFDGEWWNIDDWAEVYKALTGDYPKGIMGTYGNRCCRLDLNKYFPAGAKWDVNRPLFLFDVNANGTLYNAGHNPQSWNNPDPKKSCTAHYYTWFQDQAKNFGRTSYIYDPTIPEGVAMVCEQVDWREIIYQMAKDYYKHNQDVDFYLKLAENNKKYYPAGITGYEVFYQDIQGFWRQLYDKNPEPTYSTSGGFYYEDKTYKKDENGQDTEEYTVETKWEDFKESDIEFECDYFLKPNEVWVQAVAGQPKKLQSFKYGKLTIDQSYINKMPWSEETEGKPKPTSVIEYYNHIAKDYNEKYSEKHYYWHKNTVDAPELLNFWFDFFENEDSLSGYSIRNIGDRPKIVNDSKVTSVYFRSTPQIILQEKVNNTISATSRPVIDQRPGYTYVIIPSQYMDLFVVSSQGKSATEEIEELFYNYSCCSEQVSISCVPIYYLEPNTLISLYDEKSHINGTYQISNLSIPLTYDGMMNISASKVIN